MFIIVFPLLTYTHDRQQHGRDEGEWREQADVLTETYDALERHTAI